MQLVEQDVRAGAAMERIGFELLARDERARSGVLHTGHGSVQTPAFLPVGTRGTVKTLGSEDLEGLGAEIALANTYHLVLRPGVDLVAEHGGLHRFMAWKGALLTDSGGFQVHSLSALNVVDDDGVTFRSHLDGSPQRFTPESTVEAQARLGADLVVCLDQCLPADADRASHLAAVRRTTAWAARCRAVFGPHFRTYDYPQALFGIVQGGTDGELRRRAAAAIGDLDFPGYAIGGLAVGEPKETLLETVALLDTLLPEERPRYLMGVGTPEDLVWCVARGVDFFDCVLPTRNARNGMAFTSRGRLVIRNAAHARAALPLDPACSCWVCARYSRAYIRYLHQAGEILGLRLVTYHNLHFYLGLMHAMRAAIRARRFGAWQEDFFAAYAAA